VLPIEQLLRGSFAAAVAAADPLKIVPAHLPLPPRGRTLVVGAGKAAAAMAHAVEQHWPADAPLSGLVITRYGHAMSVDASAGSVASHPARIRVVEAAHPVPDASGARAALEILAAVQALQPQDLLLVLISGGGSSLLSLPAEGISLDDLRLVNHALLRSGAPIQAMNVVRKHLSRISGGRLAAASAAPVLALIISDVTGDDPTHIASGPCAPDPSTWGDALAVVERYALELPASVLHRLQSGATGTIPDTPKPGDALFARVENRVIATAGRSLQAAADWLQAQVPALECRILGDDICGEASDVAQEQAALVQRLMPTRRSTKRPMTKRPMALISGGECTVTLHKASVGTAENTAGKSATTTQSGQPGASRRARGGRCTEYLLALTRELGDAQGIWALAADTDGIDGSEDNAGAWMPPDSLQRARALGLDAQQYLSDHDAWGWFSALDLLITTGPTRTNVNDYRIIFLE
jgi:hydroxypyruvate reductase